MPNRGRWDDMTSAVTDKIKSVLGGDKTPQEKAEAAADKLGGASGKAVDAIRKNKEAKEKALRDAGAL